MPGWLSRHHPGDPGFRRKIAASRYLRLIPSGLSGTGGGNIPVKPALSAHPCASPRPTGNASAIYSRTEASLKALSYSEAMLSLLLSNYWGTLCLWERVGVRASSRTFYSFANTLRAASMVLLISSLLCATDIKPASNADGARYTPSSSIRWKKRLKRSTSHFTTS